MRAAAVLERVLEQLAEHQRHGRRPLAGQHHRLQPAFHLAPSQALPQHRLQPPDQPGAVDVVVMRGGQQVVHGRDRQDPVHALVERPLGRRIVDRARLQAQQRGHGLQVVLDPVVDLLDGQRLQLRHPRPRLLVQLRVLDGLPDLPCDRGQQRHLILAEGAGQPRAHVQRPLQAVARVHRHGQDRLVLVLGQVGEADEARVQVGRLGDHDRTALGRGRPGDALAQVHARPVAGVAEAPVVRGAQLEHVVRLVVQVDEAGVGLERGGDLGGDPLEHDVEVERGVDRRDRVGQQLEVPSRTVGGGHT